MIRTLPPPTVDQLPPHSEQAERDVLACALLDPACVPEIVRLPPEAFYDHRHQTAFAAICKMHADGSLIDENTLVRRLHSEHTLDAVGGVDWVVGLAASVSSAAGFQAFRATLQKIFTARSALNVFLEAGSGIRSNPQHLDKTLAHAINALNHVRGFLPCATNWARPLSGLASPGPDDPGELLRTRYLCRGGGLLLCAPTGIGKSSLAMQAMLSWALGRDCFDIKPARPVKSLLIQAENDDGDLAEMREGVLKGLGFRQEEARRATDSVWVVQEDRQTGQEFFSRTVRPLLEKHKPDLLWIDPALAYLGGEANAQRDVGAFLRNGLNPLIREFGCGVVIVHHTNKPPSGREKPDWQAGDFAYSGGGSAEWANWARAVLVLRSLGSHDVFELRAGKRGGRIGWQDADGSKTYFRHIAHATEPGVICWRAAEADDLPQTGRPKEHASEDLAALLPPEGFTSAEWQKMAKEEAGISERNFFRFKKQLVADKRAFKSKIDNKWRTQAA